MFTRKPKRGKAPWTTMPNAKVNQPRQARRVPRESVKRSKEHRLYTPLARAFVLANPTCARCGKRTTCVHHWAGRRSNYLKRETWKPSCDQCNLFAKNHPKEARAQGWIAPIGVYLT